VQDGSDHGARWWSANTLTIRFSAIRSASPFVAYLLHSPHGGPADSDEKSGLAYDTTNFYTHIASTNLRPKLPQRGKNKQGRHDLRQMGLALVVDRVTQLPLAHVLYEGARSDRKTFVEFLQPVRKRLRELTGQPDQVTLVFDAGSSSQQNPEGLERYVTAVRPSDHRALLTEAGGHLAEVPLSNGAIVRAGRTQRTIAGKQRDVVVVFSPQLHAGQLRGLQQTLSRS
jgi:transposase